jgi:hypothetical protein
MLKELVNLDIEFSCGDKYSKIQKIRFYATSFGHFHVGSTATKQHITPELFYIRSNLNFHSLA